MENIKIYKITNKTTGKCYIGRTKYTIEGRWYGHKNNAECGGKNKLSKAIQKYGIDDFTLELLEEFTIEDLDSINNEFCNSKERYYVEKYNSFRGGYNSTKGGEWVPQPEVGETTREKMSKNNRWLGKPRYGKENPNYGRKWTDEQKQRMSEKKKGSQSRLGAVLSEETKRKIGEANRGPNLKLRGRVKSQEEIEKMKKSKMGMKLPQREKTYEILFPDGSTQIIKGLLKFCKEFDLHPGNITGTSGSKGFKATRKHNK